METNHGNVARIADRSLLGGSLLALLALIVGLVVTNPARASETMSDAEKIRRLDIMLMVTGLRCRTTADNFQADYGRFTTNQITTLNQANAELRSELARKSGAAGARRALDRLSTSMANSYGQGHPWLSCANLKMVTRNLANVRGRAALLEAANQLLASSSPAHFAYARR